MSNYTKSTNFATKDNLTPGDPLKVVRGTEIDTEFNNIATAVATKTDNSAAAITGGSITGITDLAIADGGTGASTATAALNNLLPSQTSNANKYLQTDGTNVSWDPISLSTSDITGTLPVANGGTGITSFGTGIATFLGTPSSANLASAVTDETGSGALVFANTPTLVSPILGTPTSGNFSSGSFTWPTFNQNTTGTAAGLSATLAIASGGTGQTTANAAFNALAPSQTSASGKYLKSDGTNTSWDALDISTADITGTLPVANGGTGVTSSTGTGNVVLSNSPTLVTPILGTPQSGNFSTGTFTWPTFNQNTTGTAAGLSATLATTSGGTGLTSFTSGGVVYASSTSALATGSALTFDGTSTLGMSGSAVSTSVKIDTTGRYKQFEAWASGNRRFYTGFDETSLVANITTDGNHPILFSTSGTEQMRLTSTGLGIGTSSPATKIDARLSGTSSGAVVTVGNTGSGPFGGLAITDGGSYPVEMWASALVFKTGNSTYASATERARIDSSGNFQLQKNLSVGGATPTTSGTGITFPATQSASSDANTLDDYEEGTFTPVIASTGGGTNTYVRQNAKYTKVGRLVSVEIDVRLNVNSMSSGDLTITGLPFANGATVITAPLISAPTSTSSAYYIMGYILAGASTITLDRVIAAGGTVTLTAATLAGGESLGFTFSYTV